MANRTTYPLDCWKSDCTLVTMKMVGAGASDATIPENGSNLVSAVHSATGVYALTFRHSYPELRAIVGLHFGPRATDGLKASFSAIDVTAKTATLQVEVNTTDTDMASGDTLHITLLCRNSGKNT